MTDRPNSRTTSAASVLRLSFSGPHIDAEWLRDVSNYTIAGRAIVVNIGVSNASVVNYVVNHSQDIVAASFPLPPWHSTTLCDGVIDYGASLLVLRACEVTNIGNIVMEPGWRLLGDIVPHNSPFPRNTPLWLSSQDELGTIELVPSCFAGQPALGASETLAIKANLWYAPPSTDCFIHTGHGFLEVHTQIHGLGRMQKFRTTDERSMYEDLVMPPGRTHPPFFHVDANGHLDYPWHRYFADTDCIWMAIELHRAG